MTSQWLYLGGALIAMVNTLNKISWLLSYCAGVISGGMTCIQSPPQCMAVFNRSSFNVLPQTAIHLIPNIVFSSFGSVVVMDQYYE